MYRKIDDFISDYRRESESTNKILKSIDTSKKSIRINENIRSPERLVWHMTQSISKMKFRTGLCEKDELAGESIPVDFEDLISIYNNQVNSVLNNLKAQWNDSMLEEKMDFFGENYAKGIILSSIITHEIHHRAQLTIVMRALGMEVPGVYGPSKAEWAKFKMPAQE